MRKVYVLIDENNVEGTVNVEVFHNRAKAIAAATKIVTAADEMQPLHPKDDMVWCAFYGPAVGEWNFASVMAREVQ